MSEMTCLACNATTSNGLVWCDMCQYATSRRLEYLPVYFRNLARWRPGRAGSRPVPGSRVLYDGEVRSESPDRITRAVEEAGNAVTTWARALADDRGLELPDRETEVEAFADACRLLAGNLTSIGTLEWAGEFTRDIKRHEARLCGLTEESAPGWYAGECRGCETATYVVPGLTWVTCKACGRTTYARDHLEAVLNEARDWLAPPRRIAEALVALLDTELSVTRLHDRIRQWESRANREKPKRTHAVRGVDVDGDPCGPKRYRLGDVMDMVLTQGATRLNDEISDDARAAV